MKRSLPAVLCGLLLAGSGAAQAPVLRIDPGSAVEGSLASGTATFPLAALEGLGARVTTTASGARALLFADTLEFEAGAPFFLAGGRVHQLALPVVRLRGELHIPEQFFLQWLPQRHQDRLAYAGGALRLVGQPAEAPRVARAAARPEQRVVVIDPGHGGRDPGKIGPNGLAEKHAVLQISKRLADVLRERGYEVHLTRTTDTLIALADRPRLANKWKGERPVALFVSIHANSAPGNARGFETFFLSEARTEDERRVAEMENAAAAYEDTPSHTHDEFELLLNSLRNDFYVRASSDLAAVIQDRLAEFHPGPNRGVKRAGFRVLVGAIMPAVLVEVAFLSHRQEAELLRADTFQDRLARSLADAVAGFFDQNEHLWVAR